MHELNLEFTSFDIYSARVKILCVCMQQSTYLSLSCPCNAQGGWL